MLTDDPRQGWYSTCRTMQRIFYDASRQIGRPGADAQRELRDGQISIRSRRVHGVCPGRDRVAQEAGSAWRWPETRCRESARGAIRRFQPSTRASEGPFGIWRFARGEEQIIRTVIAEHGATPETLFMLSALFERQQKLAEAIAVLEEADALEDGWNLVIGRLHVLARLIPTRKMFDVPAPAAPTVMAGSSPAMTVGAAGALHP
jgi:hypothetical protein